MQDSTFGGEIVSEIFNKKAMNIGEDIMTKEEWIECVRCGAFIPDDGVGYWGTETHYGEQFDSFHVAPKSATHVHWFNK